MFSKLSGDAHYTGARLSTELTISFITKPSRAYTSFPFLSQSCHPIALFPSNTSSSFPKARNSDETMEEPRQNVQKHGGKSNAGSGLWFSLGRTRSLVLKGKRSFGYQEFWGIFSSFSRFDEDVLAPSLMKTGIFSLMFSLSFDKLVCPNENYY